MAFVIVSLLMWLVLSHAEECAEFEKVEVRDFLSSTQDLAGKIAASPSLSGYA
jgi:hypothetical protein